MREDIVLKNKFYPRGLTEYDISEYWRIYKHDIIHETNDHKVLIWISPKQGELVVKRNSKESFDGSIYIENSLDFDTYVNARVVQLSIEIPDPTNKVVIDIDCSENYPEYKMKEAVGDIIHWSHSRKEHFDTKKTVIVNTSSSYNVILYKYKKERKDVILSFLRTDLYSIFKDKYLIDKRIKHEGISLDLSPNYKRGSHVCPYSLNRNGTMCMNITNIWERWDRKTSIIDSELN